MCLINLSAQQEQEAIKSQVIKLFNFTDAGRWEDLKGVFAEKVVLDYSSFTRQPAAEMTPDQIVNAWSGFLPKFKATHHQVGNFLVEVKGNIAHLSCYGTAGHYFPNDFGKNTWTVVGAYDFELIKKGTAWKVNKMTFHFKYQDGNTDLPKIILSGKKAASVRDKNIQRVKTFLRLLEQEKIEDFSQLFAKNGKHINPFHSGLFPSEIAGRKHIYDFWKHVPGNFDGMAFPIDEIIPFADPNKVAVKFTGKIKLKNNAGIYKNDYLCIFHFNDQGKILEYYEYFNPITAAKGFGLLDKIK
jgi:ketosteroid isomerase-like protein